MKKQWKLALVVTVVAVVAVAAMMPAALAGQESPMVEWRYVGGDQAHQKYSPLTDIDASNVHELEQVWTWEHGETPLVEYETRPDAFEVTPLMIDNTLYLSTPYHQVIALDAETGQEQWRFNPEAYKDGPDLFHHRGVSYWREGDDARIFMNSRHRLFAVDAKTGQLIKSFGEDGYVMLLDGLKRPINKRHTTQTSPTIVYKNLVIIGSRIADWLQYEGEGPGTIQAFDVRTGERAWVFYTVPQSPTDPAAETWADESWRSAGHSNVWGLMSLDEERGLLYAPTSTPGSDYFGGHRVGANLYAESLLCLDANTGELQWHFQAIHHGLWDWDLSAPPTLATITVDGRQIDAVAEISKMGFTYVFDRVTGEPVWPIEERRAGGTYLDLPGTYTDVPGEVVYPTQPYPTKPPSFAGQGVFPEDANDLTPEIQRLALEEMNKYRIGPIYTPPTIEGTLQRPTPGGGGNWGGAAFDAETGFLFVKSSEGTAINRVCRNDYGDPRVDGAYGNRCLDGRSGMILGMFDPQVYARAVADPDRALASRQTPSPLGRIPIIKPPYGTLTAIDLNKGDIAWQVPFGEGSPAIRRHPLLKDVTLPDRLGTPGPAGMVVTGSGLVFIGSSDPYLYAFDKRTGKEISRVPTKYSVRANPITYRTRSGRQFVVVATGAGADAELVAFALTQ